MGSAVCLSLAEWVAVITIWLLLSSTLLIARYQKVAGMNIAKLWRLGKSELSALSTIRLDMFP